MPTRLAIGCMTGTSLDALDASLVRIQGTGLAMTAEHVRSVSRPLGSLQPLLRALADQHPFTAGDIAALSRDFSLLHVAAIKDLLRDDRANLICIHGQTVFHEPPVSWQLFNPAPIAHAFQTPVVCDLRAADLAAGGQGAPITPIADWVLLRSPSTGVAPSDPQRLAIINLGGFSNATVLSNAHARNASAALDDIRAFDICACNQLLDRIAQTAMNRPIDHDGQTALTGTANPAAAASLSSIFAARAGRSLGTGDEAWDWIERHRTSLSPADLAATACHAIANRIADSIGPVDRTYLAGGGARNGALVKALRQTSKSPVELSDTIGIPTAFRESICFAILGALCQDRVPITLPQVTGCTSPAPISGLWTFSPVSST